MGTAPEGCGRFARPSSARPGLVAARIDARELPGYINVPPRTLRATMECYSRQADLAST
jgi:hypothetical protein